LRLTLAIQELAAAKGSPLADDHKSAVHCLCAGFLHLVGDLIAIPAFCAHIETVIKTRAERTPWFLPEFAGDAKSSSAAKPLAKQRRDVTDASPAVSPPDELMDELMFNKAIITEALQSSGHDISALLTPFAPRHVVDASMTRSISDLNAITVEVDSVNSSPGLPRRQPEEEITFESLRKIINEPLSAKHDELEMKRLQIVDRFRNASFHDLIARYERKSNDLQQKLLEALAKYSSQQTIDARARPQSEAPSEGGLPEDSEFVDCVDSVIGGMGGDELAAAPTPTPPVAATDAHKEWHIYDNPLKELCVESYAAGVAGNGSAAVGPPLFAMKFPELFVY
jgi:hypothetical protein